MKIFSENYYKEIVGFLSEANNVQVADENTDSSDINEAQPSQNIEASQNNSEPVDAAVEQENINNSKAGLQEAETAMQAWNAFNAIYSKLKEAMDKAQIQNFEQLKELLNSSNNTEASPNVQ